MPSLDFVCYAPFDLISLSHHTSKLPCEVSKARRMNNIHGPVFPSENMFVIVWYFLNTALRKCYKGEGYPSRIMPSVAHRVQSNPEGVTDSEPL